MGAVGTRNPPRIARFEGAESHFREPCVVCIESLTTTAEDWDFCLGLQRRGFLAVRPDAHGAT